MKKQKTPSTFRVAERHRAVREFFVPNNKPINRRLLYVDRNDGVKAKDMPQLKCQQIVTATISDPRKAKRPIVAILKYLTLLNDQILDAFPPGKVPPVEKTRLRTKEEPAPYLKEPFCVHECTFGVLAMESEPVDPRL